MADTTTALPTTRQPRSEGLTRRAVAAPTPAALGQLLSGQAAPTESDYKGPCEVVAENRAGPRERVVAFREDRGESLKDVWDAGCDVECDCHDIGGGPGGESDGVVEQDLVGAGLYK